MYKYVAYRYLRVHVLCFGGFFNSTSFQCSICLSKYLVQEQSVYQCPGSISYLQLLSLDLSNNRLQRLDLYADLPEKCSELQVLNLSENQIRSPSELEHIAGLKKLTTLVLENNPLSQHSSDFVSYSGSLRKIFPALQLLVRVPLQKCGVCNTCVAHTNYNVSNMM